MSEHQCDDFYRINGHCRICGNVKTSTVEKPKPTRKHTNVSKVRAVIDDTQYSFSLTRYGLVVRRWHSHKTTTLTFNELLRATAIQRQLL